MLRQCSQPLRATSTCATGAWCSPGGPAALSLWESVVGEKVGALPRRSFAHCCRVTVDISPICTISSQSLDAPRGAFALGLWASNDRDRIQRFKFLTVDGAHLRWRSGKCVRTRSAGRWTTLAGCF